MKNIVITGCGDVGLCVARTCLTLGVQVSGWMRNPQQRVKLQSIGVDAHLIDFDQENNTGTVQVQERIWFHFAPPSQHGEQDNRTRNLLSQLEGVPERIIYISTTAVYGDCAGAWITEQTTLHAQSARGKRRLDAELQLQAFAKRHDIPCLILRVAGIYGPDRLPIERLRSGMRVLKQSDAPYSNRIHIDDLVSVCVAAAEYQGEHRVFNISDGAPSTMTDYFICIARHFGLPEPEQIPFDQAEQKLTAGMRVFLSESKRIDNSRMRDALGIVLKYPDLAAGLAVMDKGSIE